VALAATQRGTALGDGAALATLTRSLKIAFAKPEAGEQVWLDDRDVTDILRSQQSGEAASQVARLPEVRSALLERQRAFAREPGLVADGRDMGTIVFPGAVLKVFLTASPMERARRRYNQLKEKGISVSLRDLSREIAKRDLRDESRPVAPLRAAEDARIVDSTSLTPDEVVSRILAWLRAAGVAPREE